MINQAKKATLIQHIKEREGLGQSEILLPFELFFDGYEDEHCNICINAVSTSTMEFEGHLQSLRLRSDVAGVFVRFYEYSDAMEYSDAWIGSDTVYLVTSATSETVREWFGRFQSSEVWEEESLEKFSAPVSIPNGFRLIAVWWD